MYLTKTNWPETIPQFVVGESRGSCRSVLSICVQIQLRNLTTKCIPICQHIENRKGEGREGGGSPKTDSQLPQIPQAQGSSQDADQNENVWIQKESFYRKKSYIFTFFKAKYNNMQFNLRLSCGRMIRLLAHPLPPPPFPSATCFSFSFFYKFYKSFKPSDFKARWHFVKGRGVLPQSTYIYRVQSSVWRLPNY